MDKQSQSQSQLGKPCSENGLSFLEALKEKLTKANATLEKMIALSKSKSDKFLFLKLLAESDEQQTADRLTDLEEEHFELTNKVQELTAKKNREEASLQNVLSTREQILNEVAVLGKELSPYKESVNLVYDRMGPLNEQIAKLTEEIEDCQDKATKLEKEQERYEFEKMRNEILLEASEESSKLRELNPKLYSLYQKLDLKAESRVYELEIKIGELTQKINTRERLISELRERKENNLNEDIGKHATKRIGELRVRIRDLESKIQRLEV